MDIIHGLVVDLISSTFSTSTWSSSTPVSSEGTCVVLVDHQWDTATTAPGHSLTRSNSKTLHLAKFEFLFMKEHAEYEISIRGHK